MGMSSKKTLAEFGMLSSSVPTNRRRRMDEFMKVGDKMYGTVNTANDSITNYGGNTYSRRSPLDTQEYFGSIKANKGANIDAEKFKENIRQAEGLRLEPYKDTKGYDTVGYGHLLVDGRTGNISVDRIDKEDAEKLLQQDIQVRLKEVNALLPDFKNFPEDAQQAIFSEYYRGSIGQSDVTRALINKRRYKDAAKEFLNNDEYKEAKKNGKLGGITKRFEAVSEALMKMAKEKKEEVNLPIRKPSKEEMARLGFSTGGDVKNDKAKDPAQIARGPEVSGIPRYFGKGEHKVQLAYITDPEAELLKKLDLHDSNPPHTGPSIKNIPNYNDFGDDGEGGTTGGGGGDRREGGVGGDGGGSSGGGSGGGNTPNDRPTMADIAGPTNTPTGGGGGGGGGGTPSTSSTPPAKKKKTIGNLYGTYFNTFKNTDFLKDPVKSAFTAYNQGLLSSTNLNAYGFLGGVFGDASLGLQSTLSAENVKDLNFSGTETDVVGNVGTFQNGYDINADYNFGNDTGALSVSKEISLFDKDFTVTGSIDTDGGFTPSITYNYKKGGLLTKRK